MPVEGPQTSESWQRPICCDLHQPLHTARSIIIYTEHASNNSKDVDTEVMLQLVYSRALVTLWQNNLYLQIGCSVRHQRNHVSV